MTAPRLRPARRTPTLILSAALLGSALLGLAGARPVAIGGVVQSASVGTVTLPGGEMLPVWTLPRLGVTVRNDPSDVRLLLGTRELRYAPATGWRAVDFTLNAKLPVPQLSGGSLFVPLAALNAQGLAVLADTPALLDVAAPASVPATTLPPSPDLAQTLSPGAAPGTTPAPVPVPSPLPQPQPQPTFAVNLDTVRVSRTLHRTVEVQRVVLELSGAAQSTVTRLQNGLTVTLSGVAVTPGTQTLESGDTLTLTQTPQGASVGLTTGGGRSEIFTLNNPERIVIDTTTYLDSSVPPPVDPDALPDGVTYRPLGNLHLLSFDPAVYQPRVVSAPTGQASGVADLVKRVGGVAGVNGGYFDPGTHLPVDLVATGGLMTAPSLEKRATLGFTAQGDTLFGYPRPRYVLSGAGFSVTVNSVRAKADPNLLTGFVGDGRTRVGADRLTTLLVTPGAAAVGSALTGVVTPPAGTLAFTFDPARFPQLPRTAGAPLSTALNWRADGGWDAATDALSAGPLLVQGGRVALDPAREGFNTAASIWRPTLQVAFGTLAGQPTIAFLTHGSPEAFAAALARAGVRDAVRLDSGSSATAFVTGGYANLGGYLNTVWSRPVPNAIVLVPRADASPAARR